MATTTARTKQDVDNMTAAERLWDSLNYSYGQQRDESNRQYARAVSQNDQAMLNRGMQRSTYALQTSANLRNQAVDASNRIYNQQIADYENRLQDIENQEWQRAFQEKSFDEGVRQFNVNFDYQKGRDAVGDEQWQKAFDQSNTQNDRQLAYQYVFAILEKGGDPTDDLLARAGLSRQDANAIKAQQATGGGGGGGYSYSSGGGRSSNKPTTNPPPSSSDLGVDSIIDGEGKYRSSLPSVKDIIKQTNEAIAAQSKASQSSTPAAPSWYKTRGIQFVK